MESTTSARADRIFVEALALEPAAREGFLERECAGDLNLRAEVDALLRASDRAEQYFGELPARLGIANLLDSAETHDRAASIEAGERFGSYTLTELIGSGGMGDVWRATRSDGQYEGSVAIKLLSRTHDEAALKRFKLEATYLAKLSHPGIARLLDAGVSNNHQPYLILEYIDGLAIDRYCDERHLTIEQRIKLFLGVLDAVAHAHAHLIVHRDMKPSNVLVTTDGTVKLLDFGIAKLLSEQAELEQAGLTRQIGAALTPEFASPEQVQGDQITTASDVYSLGLLLRLLLTGSTGRPATAHESIANLCAAAKADPPTLLSTLHEFERSEPGKVAAIATFRSCSTPELERILKSDLDNIVRKACAVEPTDRYTTVAELSSDLQRYLRHEPVSAQPPTVSYRARKFLRRHRGSVLAASLAGIALTTTGIATVWQGVEAARQRDVAVQERARAQASNEFMTLLLEEVAPSGKPFTMLDLLEKGLVLLEAQNEAQQPHTAATYFEVALRFAVLGNSKRTLELLERAQTLARNEGDRDILASSLCVATVLKTRAAPEQARAHLQEALSLLGTGPEASLDAQRECAQARARIYQADGDPEKAIQVLQESLRANEQSGVPPSHKQAVLLNNIAGVYYARGMWKESLEYVERALDVLETIGRGNTMLYLALSDNRSSLLLSLGEVQTAHRLRENLLERVSALDEPAQRAFWSSYAGSLTRLAQYAKSNEILMPALERDLAEGNESSAAQARFLIGTNLVHLGQHSEALTTLETAQEYFRRSPIAGRRLLSSIIAMQAFAHLKLGMPDVATQTVTAALKQAGYEPGNATPDLKTALRFAAVIALESQDFARAEQLIADLFDINVRSARDPSSSADVGHALLLRARLRQAMGDLSTAREDAQQAIPALTNGLGADHPETQAAREVLESAPHSARVTPARDE